jgi:spermidine synthase
MRRPIAIVLTILTGFSGLVYEVTWQKYFATLLGSHSEATASILGVFLVGLSLGYWLFGRVTSRSVERARLAGRAPRLFRLYAIVEGGIGLYAFAFPWLFAAVQALSAAIPHTAAGAGFALDVLLVAVLVGPPTVLMGGTIPILTQALSTSLNDATRFHALVYGFNTAGAFFGALIGVFLLIPTLGLHATMRWMAVINVGAGLAFLLFERLPGPATAPAGTSGDASGAPPPARAYGLLALVGLLTGFAMMVLQSVSIRLAGLVLGSSEYTFGMVVAVFVFCIACGSLAVSLLPRIPPIVVLINQCSLLAYTFILYFTVESLPVWALYLRTGFGTSKADFLPFQLACFVATAVLLGPAAILSGTTLPLLFHNLRGRIGDLGSVAGMLYSWNTVGSFLGALLGGYALFFVLDLDQVYRVAMAALAASAGLLVWQLLPRASALRLQGAIAAALVVIILLPAWDPGVLTHGLFRKRELPVESLAETEALVAKMIERKLDRVIFHEDDPIASITVRRQDQDGVISLAIMSNGKGDGDTHMDYTTMSLAALIPAILVPEVKRAFVVGFGTGSTVGTLAALEGMEEVVVAEISPAVLEAAHLFEFANHRAGTRPNVRLIRSDAYRAFLRSEGRYDVIVSMPSNPWTTGIEMLYSQEFLRAARDRLSPDGVYVQWYHQYETDLASVTLVLRTYASVFDQVAVWYGLGPDFLIVGMPRTARFDDVAALQRRASRPDIRALLKSAGVGGFAALLAHELVPAGVIAAPGADAEVHTLFHPRLNHLAGRAFFRGAPGDLPKLESGEQAGIGTRNSLLRRYLAGLSAEGAKRALSAAATEACRNRHKQCITLLAELIIRHPDSPDVRALAAGVYDNVSRIRVGGRIQPSMVERILRLASPGYIEQTPVVSLEVAEYATWLYRRFFNYAVPFDPDVHLAFWNHCRSSGSERARCKEGLRTAIALDWRESGREP